MCCALRARRPPAAPFSSPPAQGLEKKPASPALVALLATHGAELSCTTPLPGVPGAPLRPSCPHGTSPAPAFGVRAPTTECQSECRPYPLPSQPARAGTWVGHTHTRAQRSSGVEGGGLAAPPAPARTPACLPAPVPPSGAQCSGGCGGPGRHVLRAPVGRPRGRNAMSKDTLLGYEIPMPASDVLVALATVVGFLPAVFVLHRTLAALLGAFAPKAHAT